MGCVALVPLVDRTPFGWLLRDYIIIIYNDIIKNNNNIVISPTARWSGFNSIKITKSF